MNALDRLLRVRGLLITVREAIVDCNDEISEAVFQTTEQALEVLQDVLPDAERFGDGDPVTATHFVIVETATLGTAMHGFGETKEEAWAAALRSMPDGWTGENCIAIPCSAGLVAAGEDCAAVMVQGMLVAASEGGRVRVEA